jgi:hypothetical protein
MADSYVPNCGCIITKWTLNFEHGFIENPIQPILISHIHVNSMQMRTADDRIREHIDVFWRPVGEATYTVTENVINKQAQFTALYRAVQSGTELTFPTAVP